MLINKSAESRNLASYHQTCCSVQINNKNDLDLFFCVPQMYSFVKVIVSVSHTHKGKFTLLDAGNLRESFSAQNNSQLSFNHEARRSHHSQPKIKLPANWGNGNLRLDAASGGADRRVDFGSGGRRTGAGTTDSIPAQLGQFGPETIAPMVRRCQGGHLSALRRLLGAQFWFRVVLDQLEKYECLISNPK